MPFSTSFRPEKPIHFGLRNARKTWAQIAPAFATSWNVLQCAVYSERMESHFVRFEENALRIPK